MATGNIGRNIVFDIKNADGTSFYGLTLNKSTFDSVVMSLGDKITGDVYYIDNTLSVTMQEYIEYKRNPNDANEEPVRFVLVSPPTIIRNGTVDDNSDLKGMTKYSFTFYHPMYMLANFPFADVAVTDDEKKYLSENKTFSWSGRGVDFLAKINKNLQGTQWFVAINQDAESIAKLNKMPDEIAPTKSDDATKSNVLTFDKNTIADALKTTYDTWTVPFVIESIKPYEYFDDDNNDYYEQGKRFVILFGLPSNEILRPSSEPFSDSVNANTRLSAPSVVYYSTNRVLVLANTKILVETYDGTTPVIIETVHGNIVASYSAEFQYDTYVYIGKTESTGTVGYSYISQTDKPFVFRFGQEVGLKNNSRTPRNNKIITRISGSGSENNIPYGYPQILWTGNQDWDYTINNDPNGPNSYPIYKGILGGAYVKLIKHPFTRKTLMPSVYRETLFNKVSPYMLDGTPNPNFDPTIELVDYYDADSSYPNPINPDSPSFEFHAFEGIKPELGVEEIVDAQPNNDTITNGKKYDQMTPAQLDGYLATTINRSRNQNEKDAITRLRNAINSSTAKYTDGNYGGAYTFSCTAEKSGGGYYVDYTSDSAAFHISTVQRSSSGGWDDTMDDDGNYVQSYFNVVLPTLEFDLYACASITQEIQINMRSGACIGCTFNIMVDWEDYKKNFYKEDGTFDPVPHTTAGDGHVRDASKYPDSSQGNITVICQKEISTFGTLMPNIYQQPKIGDRFVILGISLPTSYISSAERRLDDAMLEYMLENNVHYYDYPLKFDEHFLAKNTDILLQMRNNTIVRFKYGNEPTMALYIKQMTIKYGYGTLPQYDITLTDDVEIVLNQIGQTTEDVSRMSVQLSELQKYYSENIMQAINEKLSRVVDDVCQGLITFQQGLNSIGRAIFYNELRSPDFTSGLYNGHGWRVDNLGNAEFESMRVRSYLEIVELLVNRMQAQEGDTMFTSNDQIDKVDKVVNESTGDISYILSLKEKWSGYVTSQQFGNVLKGIINTLAAKQAGVSDINEGEYYTSWMKIVDTHSTDNNLGVNQIRVVLYGNSDVPAGKNFEPCELMTIARWGNILNPEEQGITESEKKRRRALQSSHYISTSEGRIAKLTGVNKPILESYNYGTTLGIIPDFIKNWSIANRLIDGRDYLYAQGVIVGDFIKVDIQGRPLVNYVDCGDWYDGGAQGAQPTVGHGIYLVDEKNNESLQWETHDVWHNGAYWRCLVHQPVNGVYHEPQENSAYWKKMLSSGEGGKQGKIGRFFYFGGVWENTASDKSFLLNDAQAPYFEHTESGQKRYHVFNPSTNPTGGTITKAQMLAASSDWNVEPWEAMTNDFKYLMTEAIFADKAKFGGAIVNGDWMISQYGTKRGTTPSGVPDYQYFDPFLPKGSSQIINNKTISRDSDTTFIIEVIGGREYSFDIMSNLSSTVGGTLSVTVDGTSYSKTVNSDVYTIKYTPETSGTYTMRFTNNALAAVTVSVLMYYENAFTPNYAVNLRTGKQYLQNADISGNVSASSIIAENEQMTTSIQAGVLTIRSKTTPSYGMFAVNGSGEIILQMYDKDGILRVNLGGSPTITVSGQWLEKKMKKFNVQNLNEITDSDCVVYAKDCTTYYQLQLGYVKQNGTILNYIMPNGSTVSIQDAESINGRTYLDRNTNSLKIDGYFTNKNDAIFMKTIGQDDVEYSFCPIFEYNDGLLVQRHEHIMT